MAEVVFTGKGALQLSREFAATYNPFTIIMGTENASTLPLLQDRATANTATIFVCYNKTCRLPVTTVAEALTELT
jgi:uncharacterized protein YyaL (SSP411 family)